MTTPEDLIKSAATIHGAATPGPWMFDAGSDAITHEGRDEDGVVAVLDIYEYSDARFIAAARTLVPELAAALKYSIEYRTHELQHCEARHRMLIKERNDARAELKESNVERKRLDDGWREANFRINDLMGYQDDNEGDVDIAGRIAELTRERDEARSELARLKESK